MKQRLNHMKRWTVCLSVCVFIILSGITAVLVNQGYVQAIRRLVRSTTTSSIRELSVSRAQYMDERLRSELMALQSLASAIGEYEDIFSGSGLAEEYKKRQGATCVWICEDLDRVWNTNQERELTPDQKQLFEEALQGEEGIACLFI